MLKSVALEAVLVTLAGALFALVANAVSPRGLRLNTDYFPFVPAAALPSAQIASTEAPNSNNGTNAVEVRLRQRGLQSIPHDTLVALVAAPASADGSVVIIDARGSSAYAKGHLSGAWPLDPFRADEYLPELLPRCLAADRVIVYCTGGECEDSELAAIRLRDAGVPSERIYIYPGGIQAWTRLAQPVETGPRRGP